MTSPKRPSLLIGEVLQWKEGDVLEVKSVDQENPFFGCTVRVRNRGVSWLPCPLVKNTASLGCAAWRCSNPVRNGWPVMPLMARAQGGTVGPVGWAEEELPKVEKNEGVVAPVTGETEEAPEPKCGRPRNWPWKMRRCRAAFDDAADETAVELSPRR